MLYIDPPRIIPNDHPTAPRCFRGRQAAHLMADTEAELVEYARSIGMAPGWIQKRGTAYAHFDLVGQHLETALADERVKKVSVREMVELIRGRRETRPRKPRRPAVATEDGGK